METTDHIANLRRRRGYQIGRFTTASKRLDEYEQCDQKDKSSLPVHQAWVEDAWKQYRLLQDQLEDLGEEANPRDPELESTYFNLIVRISKLMTNTPASTSTPPIRDSSNIAEPAAIKLPEMHLSTFDGTMENWHSFYDSFLSTIDRSEQLTPVQKFQYLRTSLTGKAARTIQSLDTTELNYPIALDTLKNKFDCHRQVCMRHWDLILDYPEITVETPEAIDDFIETVQINLQALERLGEPITSNVVLLRLFTWKLPSTIIHKWQRTLPDKRMPSYTHLLEFLKTRTNGDRISYTKIVKKRASDSHNRQRQTAPRTHTFITTQRTLVCPTCQGSHEIWNCNVFKAKSIKNRIETAKRASLCTNCLSKGHSVAQCSAGSCRICGLRHHTYLHRDQSSEKSRSSSSQSSSSHSSSDRSSGRRSPPSSPTPRTESHKADSRTSLLSEPSYHDLLVTAQVKILDDKAQPVRCRALLDTGSSMNFITEKLAKTLKLGQQKCSVPIGALNALSTTSKHYITATITSIDGTYERTLTFLIIPTISTWVPDQPVDRSIIQIPRNLQLADPRFHIPAPIEIILSAGPTLASLCVGQLDISHSNGPDLRLQKTRFGWVIGGSPTSQSAAHTFHASTAALQADLARFWEIDEGPLISHISEAERQCEEHFRKHVQRTDEGRYIVALPFNNTTSSLGSSKAIAMKRLTSLSRRFQRDKQFEADYHAVIKEYLELGHMTRVTTDRAIDDGYFLPHHGVIKESSQTTKLRVVFDGSAPTTTGASLNDILHTGPKLQEDLFYILLRFRSHQYVLTGDVEKMYRQFLVRPEDRKFQQILWRNTKGEVDTYQLNTLTFGLSAAPYLAIRCLKQLADDEGHRYPRAAAILQRDFYVDDVLTGVDTKDEARSLRIELTELLKLAGLNIRKWASNSRELLNGLPEQDINDKLLLGESQTVKTLGVVWNSSDDSILYSVKINPITPQITKRIISSEIAKIYDPLGLLSPVIVRAKMLLQRIWTLKIDWDESLPADVHTEWRKYYTQLPLLNNIRFPRKTIIKSAAEIELHGFCDASEKAYGACIYLRTITPDGHVWIRLLTAKSKVAPLKSLTIPRLELSGALLLTSLTTTVRQALQNNISRTVYWTDSTIVLHWINTSPHTLKTFVANRVSDIQNKTHTSDWRHIPTADNPADLISRGQLPEDFLRSTIWQHGPEWLQQPEERWPTWNPVPLTEIPEQKKATCLSLIPADHSLLERFSSWPKLIRVIARCLRWRQKQDRGSPLTTHDLTIAHNRLITLLQLCYFSDELHNLQTNRNSTVKGKLQRLNPFLDKDGMLRVGGRLSHSTLPFNQKHPIILPKSFVTSLIIEHEHLINLHSGIQATLYSLRRSYWPIDGRSQVWSTLKKCVRCCRTNPPPVDYIMGDLPAARITESRPFTNVGIDYCGPFYVKERKDRNRRKIKVYVSIFVCLAVKAVHIELVSDLTSEAFIAALRRFIARRGFCTTIYSDNGTNFVGANNELRELRNLLRSDDHKVRVQSFLADRRIEWRFIPPNSPHFGGLWEAAVKSFKRHLRRVAGNELLTFENLNTLIIEIESILNSRPLTPISTDPNDLLVLTPGHFLIGDALTGLRERDFTDTPTNHLSSWQHIQKIKQHFWQRWHREYLNELNIRNKWSKGSHGIREGSIVLLREDNVPPMQWPLGRIIKVQPGADGIIRTATVRTATSTLDRSVKRMVPLPSRSPTDDSETPNSYDV
ncbi:uncharacterized protein [Bombus fervidus]|uniref:uncharacterized protein n=1 Tax=Bombus fervidus TaxID=203811 RepID=UPI003AB3B207